MMGRWLRVCVVVGLAACGGGGGGRDGGGDDDQPDASVPPPPPAVCDVPVELVDTSAPDRVVGDGTAASCTEAALRAAVGAGGVITFACGPDPATIVVTSALTLTADAVIDGGDTITISGGDTTRIIDMDTGNFEATGPNLTVQRMTLRNGHAMGAVLDGGGGAIYFVGGSVTAIDAVFTDNVAAEMGPDVAGGAIYGIGVGAVTVVGSRFAGNRASNGGAIGALGSAVTIVNTTISDNRATGFGANYVEGGVQMGEGGNGGAVAMDGMGRELYVCGSTFARNSSGAYGGAIFRTGYASEPNEIHRSAFTDNEARDRTGGEADLPSGAGALYLQGVNVTMTATTISSSRARGTAGVWILGHGAAPGVANLTNVTITGNATYPRADFTMRGVGAGVTIGDNTTGTLLNVTIAGNSAQFGSGVWNASPLTIRNSIIANDAENEYTPLNCTGSMYDHPSAAGGGVLQWPTGLSASDMDCIAGVVRMDPQMGALGDNGGPTPTMLPGAAGLPAGTGCPPTDQRGMPRGEPCTIGAVELP
jgi:hypothetical protein